jgi:hypothetical protein
MCLAEMLTAQLASRAPGLYPGRRRASRAKRALPHGADAPDAVTAVNQDTAN